MDSREDPNSPSAVVIDSTGSTPGSLTEEDTASINSGNSVSLHPQARNFHLDESLPSRGPPPGGGQSRRLILKEKMSSILKSFSYKKYLLKRLPILKWLPNYRVKKDLLPDGIAGITVALTAIPQSMAYANIAGLSPEYGLYSSYISCFVYLFLGSCRQMTIGPTSLMELLVFETCGTNFASCVILVGFWAGIIQLLMGILKLGAVVSLISDPVTIGFVAGASMTASSSQIRSFLGLTGPSGSSFIGYIREAIRNIKTAKVGDSCLGLGCVFFLLLFKNLKDYVKPSTETCKGKIFAKALWFLSIGRNAIVVICATGLAAALSDPPFALTGTVKQGFPTPKPPDFVLPASGFYPRNETKTDDLTFWETWDELRTAPLMIAIVSILQNVAIGKAFGSGQSIDATQEMIALGVSHICASFFSSIPTAGSFTRSAVNEASGVKSPIGGIFTGLIVIFALSFLTRWFAYIPKATLAAVIFCAVIPMIEYETIIPMWKVSKTDVITTLVTFVASILLGMEYGILVGVGVSLVFYMYRPVRPKMIWYIEEISKSLGTGSEERRRINSKPTAGYSSTDIDVEDKSLVHEMGRKSYIFVSPEQGFKFPSVDAIRSKINKLALGNPEIKLIVLDCRNMLYMDYTSASALSSLVKALKKTGKSLVFLGCRKDYVEMIKVVGLKEPECYDSIADICRKFAHLL